MNMMQLKNESLDLYQSVVYEQSDFLSELVPYIYIFLICA